MKDTKCIGCKGTGYQGPQCSPDIPLSLRPIGCSTCSICRGTGKAIELMPAEDIGMNGDQAESNRRIMEEKITSAVDEAMGGDNPDILMDCVYLEEDIQLAMMELCQIQTHGVQDINCLDFRKAKQLAAIALKINNLIAEKLRGYV